MIATERKGRMSINIFLNLASVKWMLFKPGTFDRNSGFGEPDIERAEGIVENRKNTKAQELFRLAKRVLKEQNKEHDWKLEWKTVEPIAEKDKHTLLVDYSIGALFFCKVITPFEYDLSEPAFDESGLLLAMKQIPKEKEDELEGAMQ